MLSLRKCGILIFTNRADIGLLGARDRLYALYQFTAASGAHLACFVAFLLAEPIFPLVLLLIGRQKHEIEMESALIKWMAFLNDYRKIGGRVVAGCDAGLPCAYMDTISFVNWNCSRGRLHAFGSCESGDLGQGGSVEAEEFG